MNPNGFGVDSIEKIEQIKRAIEENQIDYILISSTDKHWKLPNKNQMKRLLRAVYQNTKVSSANSRVIGGKWTSYILHIDTYKDSFGR